MLFKRVETASSAFAVTGLYFLNDRFSKIAQTRRPSSRSELKIQDIARHYKQDDALNPEMIGHGIDSLYTGTCDSRREKSAYIRNLEKCQGLKTEWPQEFAWSQRWISE